MAFPPCLLLPSWVPSETRHFTEEIKEAFSSLGPNACALGRPDGVIPQHT